MSSIRIALLICLAAGLPGTISADTSRDVGASDPPPPAGPALSPSFALQPVTVNGGGGVSLSAGFRLNGTAAQDAPAEAASSEHFVLQSGFWGFAGTSLVPVLLTVNPNTGTPGAVDLSWSGNNAPYDLYRSADCSDLFASPFAVTSEREYTDAAPLPDALVCYSVLGTSPGTSPSPPPLPSGVNP